MKRGKFDILNRTDDIVPYIGRVKQRRPSRGSSFLKALRALAKGYRLGKKLGGGVRSGGGFSKVRKGNRSHSQRVTVKARFVNLRTKGGVKGIVRHVRYLQREGVSESGDAGRIFDANGEIREKITSETFAEWDSDRHYWRLIISPEFGRDLDLNSFTKELVQGMERDLGTPLKYFYAPHYNTDRPHVHLIVRGVRSDGSSLIIPRDYISNGIRILAQEIATKYLGPRIEREVFKQFLKEVTADRFVQLDRALIKQALQTGGQIDLRIREKGRRGDYRDLKVKRLKHLRELGLSREARSGIWELRDGLESVLRKISLRGDILKTIHSIQKAGRHDFSFLDLETLRGRTLLRIFHKGLADELNDTHYIVGEGRDGQNYYLDLGTVKNIDPASFRVGDIIAVDRELAPNGSQNLKAQVLSHGPLIELPSVNGVTFLDRMIATGDSSIDSKYSGSFSRDLKEAIEKRLAFLKDKRELFEPGGGLKSNFIDQLYSLELRVEASRIREKFKVSLDHVSIQNGDYTFKGFEDLPSGVHAVFLSQNRFSLVPFKEQMARLKNGDQVKIKIISTKRDRYDQTIGEALNIKIITINRKFNRKGGHR